MADPAYPLPGVSSIETLMEWEEFFRPWNNGVMSGFGDNLAGSLNTGARTAVVGTGAANLRGFHKEVTAATATAIPDPSAANRIDRLVLRLDRAAVDVDDFVTPVVITGTSGSTTPPAIQASTAPTGKWDLTICRWTSQANGALTGLVDERYYTNGAIRSTARPSPARPRLGYELDTGRLVWADSADWVYITSPDTGDISLTPSTGWASDGSVAGSRRDEIVSIDVNLRRSGGTVTEGGESQILTLPTTLRPTSRTKYFAVIVSGDNNCRADVLTDGRVMLRQLLVDIPTNAEVRLTMTYRQ